MIAKIKIDKVLLESLIKDGILDTSNYELLSIDDDSDDSYDYSTHELYNKLQELKKASNKAYKELKTLEYNIRHNKI